MIEGHAKRPEVGHEPCQVSATSGPSPVEDGSN